MLFILNFSKILYMFRKKPYVFSYNLWASSRLQEITRVLIFYYISFYWKLILVRVSNIHILNRLLFPFHNLFLAIFLVVFFILRIFWVFRFFDPNSIWNQSCTFIQPLFVINNHQVTFLPYQLSQRPNSNSISIKFQWSL